jgi:esterase FrsA
MNDVAELKQFAEVHARGQRIRDFQDVLGRIRTDDGDAPGSWTGEWNRAAETLERRGRLLDAYRRYNMARFPYVDGAARQRSLERCVDAFNRWRSGHPGISRVDVDFMDGRIRCWTSGLSTTDRRPVLLIMGGIVTIKEQWAPLLASARRLGMAIVVTELPGVGENTVRYDAKSWRMLSAVLDAIAGRADVTHTYAVALSFSGHLALRCAMEDTRIKGVITSGAPISDFFTGAGRIPQITVDTLAHMTGMEPAQIRAGMGDWALTGEQLGGLEIPVCYMACRQDEIIPPGELRLLRDHVRRLDVLEFDDVHGAPRHVAEAQLWILRSLFRMRGVRDPRSAVIGLLWRTARARRALRR